MEQEACTLVFWKGGKSANPNNLEQKKIQKLSIDSESTTDISFLEEYSNIEELTLIGKYTGIEVLPSLTRLKTLNLWLSSPADWTGMNLQNLTGLHIRGERNGDISPLLSQVSYLHLEEMRKTDDISHLLSHSPNIQKLYLQTLPSLEVLPDMTRNPKLYTLKLYELHRLEDLSSLVFSNIEYIAASLIADKIPASLLARSILNIPKLKKAALSLVDRSERRYAKIKKEFKATGKTYLLDENISKMDIWLKL